MTSYVPKKNPHAARPGPSVVDRFWFRCSFFRSLLRSSAMRRKRMGCCMPSYHHASYIAPALVHRVKAVCSTRVPRSTISHVPKHEHPHLNLTFPSPRKLPAAVEILLSDLLKKDDVSYGRIIHIAAKPCRCRAYCARGSQVSFVRPHLSPRECFVPRSLAGARRGEEKLACERKTLLASFSPGCIVCRWRASIWGLKNLCIERAACVPAS